MNGVVANIKYTDREREFFDFLFNVSKSKGSEFIEGSEFAGLMRKSNLPKVINIEF